MNVLGSVSFIKKLKQQAVELQKQISEYVGSDTDEEYLQLNHQLVVVHNCIKFE